MGYEEYRNDMETLICEKLKEIEKREKVKILHAVESGSRAWGFASPDSDYDVRFIYIRQEKYYLGLEGKSDFIDWELNETLDINGWDISKVLQHFHKSNATMYEWANSPIIYYTTPEWAKIRQVSLEYFSCKSAMYHYYGTANKNYVEYLQDDMVKYKKYFYVLRPILACKWIEKRKCPPPVLFQELVEEVLEKDMKEVVENLMEQKVRMTEGEKGGRIESLNAYIAENLLYFKQTTNLMADNRKTEWEPLNELFQELLQNTTTIIIRPAMLDDAEKLLEIYAPYVTDTAISFEYEVPTLQEFRVRMENILQRYPYLVIEENQEIKGYAHARPFVEREAYDWAAETTIYLKKGCQKSGLGGRLYQALEEMLKEQNITNLYACIAYPKQDDEYVTRNSVDFHAHQGYKIVGEFHKCGYKFGRWYDMVWMEKIIAEHLEKPEKMVPFQKNKKRVK